VKRFIAIDLGAESGRVIVGTLDGDRLDMEEVFRFANTPVEVHGSVYWDVLHLFAGIKAGLARAAQRHSSAADEGAFESIGVDTWGIDFALLDTQGELVGNPHTYRDARTAGVMDAVLAQIPAQEIYEASGGIQFMGLNSLYQLRSMARDHAALLAAAAHFVMMPDLFNYWLTGRIAVEYTAATATQFYDSAQGQWATGLLERLDLPTRILGEVVPPGTVLGNLLPAVAQEVGLARVPVVAVASHDTASAVVAVPAEEESFLWLSSGTWSLLGGVADKALVTPEALAANMSSYGGAGGKVLPWRNIMGLWLVQECRRLWERQGRAYTYEALTQMAAQAPPFAAVINPDDATFLAPADMPVALRDYCIRTGQPVPADDGALIRTALEGLALRYRWVADRLEELLGRRFPVLHIVGGGSQNPLLCQFAADALNRPVLAGPVEATALGNVAQQAVAVGAIASLQEARRLVRGTTSVTRYTPQNPQVWDAPYRRFCALAE
jgi:rhamnulokinase